MKYPVVFVAIVNRENKILLIRRSKRETSRPGHWECPGGHRNEHESARECGIREVYEETKLQAKVSPLAIPMNLSNHEIGVMLFGVCEECDVKLNPETHDAYAWCDEESIERYQPQHPYLKIQIKTLIKKNMANLEESRTSKIAASEEGYEENQSDSATTLDDLGYPVHYSLDKPRWMSCAEESLGIKAPDLELWSAKQAPIVADEVFPFQELGEDGVCISINVRRALEDAGEDGRCVPRSESIEVFPGPLSDVKKISRALKKAGFAVKLHPRGYAIVTAENLNTKITVEAPDLAQEVKKADPGSMVNQTGEKLEIETDKPGDVMQSLNSNPV